MGQPSFAESIDGRGGHAYSDAVVKGAADGLMPEDHSGVSEKARSA